MTTIKIVFLYTRFADYFYWCLNFFLLNNPNYKAIVIRYSPDENAPFKFKENNQLQLLDKSIFNNHHDLKKFLISLNPASIYIAGWSDRDYLKASKYFTRQIPVILGLDNPWRGSIRQRIGILIYKIFISKIFTNVWVAGNPQYLFARRLGFSDNKILRQLYCANTKIFESAYLNIKSSKIKQYPKKLIYVGRYVKYKNPLLLVRLFDDLVRDNKTNGWTLELIGSGPLYKELKSYQNEHISIQNFINPTDLPKKLTESGAFCLPSDNEHWGLVVHEASASGLPLILSDTTYSGTEFLINDYNGYAFKSCKTDSFKSTLIKLFSKTEKDLIKMGEKSYQLSKKISHKGWSANLLRVLNSYEE